MATQLPSRSARIRHFRRDKQWLPEEISLLAELSALGATGQDAARRLGRSITAVRQMAAVHKLTLRRSPQGPRQCMRAAMSDRDKRAFFTARGVRPRSKNQYGEES